MDWLTGGGGADTLIGNAGDDVLYGNGRAQYFDGADHLFGDDVSSREDLVGIEDSTDGDDTIAGGNGRNQVYGSGGRDYILAGPDDDWISAGGGDDDDTILGGRGRDVIWDLIIPVSFLLGHHE